MTVYRILAASAVLVAFSACGGADQPGADDPQTPAIDTTIVTDIPREPLTEVDLGDMDLADLSVEIPWTVNAVSRDPAAAAARATLNLVTSVGTDDFDRIRFEFTATTPFPGYEVRWADVGEELSCGEASYQVDTDAERLLVVRMHPARLAYAVPPRQVRDAARFLDEGFVCGDEGQAVVWAAGLSAGEQVRVMEFRNPNRLVVDVR